MAERVGFESTSDMETKESCGATRPSKELKRIEGDSYCPFIAPEFHLTFSPSNEET
jgi:hypothetical protein